MTNEPTLTGTGEDGEADDLIAVDGQTANGCSTISSASLSLVVGTGMVGDADVVLVPYVDCDLSGTFGSSDTERELSITLTLDNAAFLLEEFATEFAAVIPVLNSIAAGQIKPVPERMEFTEQCLGRASANIGLALKHLRDLPLPAQ